MTLDEIVREWDTDSNIDRADIIGESVRVPKLHNKYYKFMLSESAVYRKLEQLQKELEYNKWMLYSGKMDKADLDRLGWEQCDVKTLKADIPRIMEADADIQKMNIQIGVQKDKIDYLREIVKSISARTFLFGHMIESQKIELGKL